LDALKVLIEKTKTVAYFCPNHDRELTPTERENIYYCVDCCGVYGVLELITKTKWNFQVFGETEGKSVLRLRAEEKIECELSQFLRKYQKKGLNVGGILEDLDRAITQRHIEKENHIKPAITAGLMAYLREWERDKLREAYIQYGLITDMGVKEFEIITGQKVVGAGYDGENFMAHQQLITNLSLHLKWCDEEAKNLTRYILTEQDFAKLRKLLAKFTHDFIKLTQTTLSKGLSPDVVFWYLYTKPWPMAEDFILIKPEMHKVPTGYYGYYGAVSVLWHRYVRKGLNVKRLRDAIGKLLLTMQQKFGKNLREKDLKVLSETEYTKTSTLFQEYAAKFVSGLTDIIYECHVRLEKNESKR